MLQWQVGRGSKVEGKASFDVVNVHCTVLIRKESDCVGIFCCFRFLFCNAICDPDPSNKICICRYPDPPYTRPIPDPVDAYSECEKTEETLLTSWYPAVTAVFADKNITKGLKVTKSNSNFLDITWNLVEHEILHEIFRVVSLFHRYILCYISENLLILWQWSHSSVLLKTDFAIQFNSIVLDSTITSTLKHFFLNTVI